MQCLSCYWNKGQSVCLSLQTQIRHRFPSQKDQTPSSHHWERTRAQFYLTTQAFTGDHSVPCWTRLLPGSCREGQPSLYRIQNLWRIPHIPNPNLKVHSQCPLEWKYHVDVVLPCSWLKLQCLQSVTGTKQTDSKYVLVLLMNYLMPCLEMLCFPKLLLYLVMHDKL